MNDLFPPPVIERNAQVVAGSMFHYGGRALLVVKSYGVDSAAPVIVEELTDLFTLKGQLGLWSADGVTRAKRGRR